MPECEKRSTPCARSMHFTHFAQQWNIHFAYPAVISAAPQSRLGKWSRLLNGYSLRSRMDSFQVKHSNTKLDIDYADYTYYILSISSYKYTITSFFFKNLYTNVYSVYIYNMLTIFSNKSTSLSYGAISDDATEHTGSMPWVIKQWEFRQQNIKFLAVSG